MKKSKVKVVKKVKKDLNQKTIIVKAKPQPKLVSKKSNLTVDVYNTQGKIVGKKNLPAEIFGAKVNQKLLSQAVRVFLANQRKATASTKTRGEVRGGGIKPRRQKGTGRARIGSIRAPHWRGGGVIFGPKPKEVYLKLTKKMRRLALFAALTDKAQNRQILVIAGLEKIEPKTKKLAKCLENFKEKKLGKVLLVLPQKVENLERAARNLPNINLEKAATLNTYQVLNHQTLLFLAETVEKIEEVFKKKQRTK